MDKYATIVRVLEKTILPEYPWIKSVEIRNIRERSFCDLFDILYHTTLEKELLFEPNLTKKIRTETASIIAALAFPNTRLMLTIFRRNKF